MMRRPVQGLSSEGDAVLRRNTMILILSLCLLAPSALAGDSGGSDGSLLGLGLKAVVKGKDRPAIILRPHATFRRLSVTLERSDGVKTVLKSGKLRRGKTKELRFKQPVGVFEYRARFEVVWDDGVISDFTTTFKITQVGELRLNMGAGDVDMEARTMRFRITNPAQEAELVILGAKGKRLDVVTRSFDNPAPGSVLTLEWDAVDDEIVRMDLKVTDVAGFFAGMQVIPFSIEIPHDDVEFASGKHSIRPAEEAKLRTTLGHIQKALATHGTLLTLRLYIGGCTDTVGGRASNQALSERRARAISTWFRKHGVSVPTLFKGYGESRLAVRTPDETDEPKNRRAEYVISSLPPPGGGWHKL